MQSKILSVIAVIVAIVFSQFSEFTEKDSPNNNQKHEEPKPLAKKVDSGGYQLKSFNIDFNHILDGEINKRGKAVGGHYAKSKNLKVVRYIGDVDKNGVFRAKIAIWDKNNNKWVNKQATTSFFPKEWSSQKIKQQVKFSLNNANEFNQSNLKWQGKSESGIDIHGWYKQNGDVATAYPIYKNN